MISHSRTVPIRDVTLSRIRATALLAAGEAACVDLGRLAQPNALLSSAYETDF